MTLRPQATVSRDLTPITRPAAQRGLSIHWLINIAGNVAVFVPLGPRRWPNLRAESKRACSGAAASGAV